MERAIILASIGHLRYLRLFTESAKQYVKDPIYVHISNDISGGEAQGFLTVNGMNVSVTLDTPIMKAQNFVTKQALKDGAEYIIQVADDMVFLPGWDDGLDQWLRPDRVCAFELLSPHQGSYPPSVPAGNTPEEFQWDVAIAEAVRRRAAQGCTPVTDEIFPCATITHRSLWEQGLTWDERLDPFYGTSDITLAWTVMHMDPNISLASLPGNYLYHFGQGSLYHRPVINPWDRFIEMFGVDIGNAWEWVNKETVIRESRKCG